MRRLAVLALTLVASAVGASDDGVFDQAADLVAPEAPAPAFAPSLQWSGRSTVEFGVVAAPASGGALATSTLAVDADPQPGLHLRTAFATSVPGAVALTVSELWAQSSTSAAWLVRLGLQPLSWQTARVFDTIDLANHVGNDLSARGQAVVGPFTLDALVSAPVPSGPRPPAPGPFDQPSLASTTPLVPLDAATGAGRLELRLPLGSVALAARQSSLSEASGSLRLTLGKVDLFGETLVQHQFHHPGYWTATVVGFFTQISPVQLYGEASFDHKKSPATEQRQVLLAARWLGVVVPSGQLGLEWRHSLSDGTGRLLPGVSADLLPGLRSDLGLVFAYRTTGPSGLYFTEGTTSQAATGARLKVSVSY